MDKRVVVVKLGGSMLSDKKRDFSYRTEAVASIARSISKSGVNAVVVHGGGAFGHPVAMKYGLSSRSYSRSSRGVSETRRAMLDLNLRVCDSFIAGGLSPYTFSPFPLLTAAGREGAAWLRDIISAGLTPVTFGDVIHDQMGFRILSGDTIALTLSKLLGPSRCIFAMDVEGVMSPKGVVKTIDSKVAARLGLSRSDDATGGIALKVREALKIASAGTEVAFVSGLRVPEFSKALKGLSFHGTTVKVPSRD